MSGKLSDFNISKRKIIIILIIGIILIALFCFFRNMAGGAEEIDFTVLSEAAVPQDITSSVIPQYRDLERALACMVDGKVYVIVTRGEKPSSGFDVYIDRMTISEDESGSSVLSVYANFTDPEQGTAVAQVLTYPLQVAESSLTELPDKIELKVQYH